MIELPAFLFMVLAPLVAVMIVFLAYLCHELNKTANKKIKTLQQSVEEYGSSLERHVALLATTATRVTDAKADIVILDKGIQNLRSEITGLRSKSVPDAGTLATEVHDEVLEKIAENLSKELAKFHVRQEEFDREISDYGLRIETVKAELMGDIGYLVSYLAGDATTPYFYGRDITSRVSAIEADVKRIDSAADHLKTTTGGTDTYYITETPAVTTAWEVSDPDPSYSSAGVPVASGSDSGSESKS